MNTPKGMSHTESAPCNKVSVVDEPFANGPTFTTPIAATGQVVVPSVIDGVPLPNEVTSTATEY